MSVITNIVLYFFRSLFQSLWFLFILFVPCILLIVLLQSCSTFMRNKLLRVLPIGFVVYSTAPGVMIHEFGHLVFCWAFLHTVWRVSFFSPMEDGTLGYVSHNYNRNSLYQKIGLFFIGTGPIWFGLFFLSLVSKMFLPDSIFNPELNGIEQLKEFFTCVFSVSFWSDITHWIWFYLLFAIATHITLSPPDLAGAWQGFVTFVLAIVSAFLLLGWTTAFQNFTSNVTTSYLRWMESIFLPIILVSAFSILIGIICAVLPPSQICHRNY